MTVTPVVIYTDGACKGNPGPGGWGALLSWNGHEREICGGEARTTNNRMELLAAVRALQALKKPSNVELYTDSQYVQKGMSSWLRKWKAAGRLESGRNKVKNADLWKELDAIASVHRVNWRWVEGHSGIDGNERADELARKGMIPFL